ncbi:unnamed protein product, partial [Ixodes pacificus]
MYSSFAPHVRNYLQALLEYAVQNLKTTHAVRVISAGEGGPRDGTRQFCDRFKLLLPYAGQSVTWEVIFQAHRPEFPPDFIFDDMSFLPKIEDIPVSFQQLRRSRVTLSSRGPYRFGETHFVELRFV